MSLDDLSPRELQTVRLLVQGHPKKEVAFRMGINYRTATSHMRNIRTKLSVANDTQLGILVHKAQPSWLSET